MISVLAEGQHGVVGRRQLLAAGVSDEAIRRRLATRRLYRVHDGVYSIARRPGQRGLFAAAVLAAGGAVSHRSAAALLELRAQASGEVHVTTPTWSGRQEGIRIHRTRHLHPDDVSAVDGIPCTAWARTVIDCAADPRASDLRRMLERAQVLRIYDARAMAEALDRANGKRGVAKLRALVTDLTDEPPPTRSELEARFLDLVRSASLPSPVTNGMVLGYEVDFHWPEHRLIVETDGVRTHGTEAAFHADRERDLALELAGWHVLRITWRQLTREPEKVTALLRARLGGG